MAGNKFLTNNAGQITEIAGQQTSTGASAGQIVALNSSAQIDVTLLPTGIGADTATVVASEALSAGAFVNIWNNAGTPNVRNADNTAASAGKKAHGFVLTAFSSAATATVYFNGNNNAVTGQTAGDVFLGTAGAATATAPTTSGYTVQKLGAATSATNINFTLNQPIVLA